LTSVQNKACQLLKEAVAGPLNRSEDGICIFQNIDIELDDNELNDKESENLKENK